MNKKSKQTIVKLAVSGSLLYMGASCLVAIGPFGAYLSTQIVDKLGVIRFAAAGMVAWMMYIFGTRKKQLFQWAYIAVTIIFIGAALSTIQPGAFGAISDAIVANMFGPTEGFRKLLVWIITALMIIIPNTRDIRLSDLKGMLGNAKPDLSNGFSFFVPAAASAKEPSSDGYKPIPFARFGSLADDKAFMKNKYTFPIGQKEDGRPLYAKLGDDTSHYLIAGMIGSGKSVFLQTLISALAYKNSPDDMLLKPRYYDVRKPF